MIRRLTTLVLVCLLLLSGRGAASEKLAEVSVLDIRPAQPAAGYASSTASQQVKFKNVQSEASLREVMLKEKPLRAVRGPGGAIYLTDGHHRALGVFRTAAAVCENAKPQEQVESCMQGVRVRVRIDADYSKQSWEEFLDLLQRDNNIYLPAAVRKKLASGELTKKDVFTQVLPSTLGKLANDPLRSAIGTLFYSQGISGNHFENYVEFLLAERLDNAVTVKPGQEFDPDVQIRLLKAVFGNDSLVHYLRCLARRAPEDWKKAQRQINTAVGLDPATPFDAGLCRSGR